MVYSCALRQVNVTRRCREAARIWCSATVHAGMKCGCLISLKRVISAEFWPWQGGTDMNVIVVYRTSLNMSR